MLGFFSTKNVDQSKSEFSVLTLQNGEGLELKLGSYIATNEHGIVMVSLAAFYIVINQTEHKIQLQSEANFSDKNVHNQIFAVEPEDGSMNAVCIFSHPKTASMKNRVRFRVADSGWTDPMSFETVGGEFDFSVKSLLTQKWYNIGGYVTIGSGKVFLNRIY